MNTRTAKTLLLAGIGTAILLAGWQLAGATVDIEADRTRVAVVWTSGDPDVAHKMVFMYLHNSQKQAWFDENLLIVWGPSSRLLAGDKELQAEVQAMMNDGVTVQACIACANLYGVAQDLRDLGIEVKPMGEPLTRLIQDPDWDVITF